MYKKSRQAFSMAQIALMLMIVALIIAVSVPLATHNSKKAQNPNGNYSDSKTDYDSNEKSDGQNSSYDNSSSNSSYSDSNASDAYRNERARELSEMEARMNSRMASLIEQNKSEPSSPGRNVVSDKYTCTIEGRVDQNGNIIPIDGNHGEKINQLKSTTGQRFVFICEYNK